MVITLPKLNVKNEVKATQIFTDAVKGWEDTKIVFKGKTFDGVKVYTSEGMFKVFATPVEFTSKLALSKSTGEVVNVLPLAPVKGYALLDVKTVNANVKQLKA